MRAALIVASRIARLALGRDHTRGENNVEVNCLRTCPTGGGACETEPAPFCLIACRVLDVPVPEIVLQRAGIAPMVEELITIAMPQPMRSIAARLSTTPTQNMKP